jgi:predicted DNA-binding protein YlxM (UPF0122 family)
VGNITDFIEASRVLKRVNAMNVVNRRIIHGMINGVSITHMAHEAGVSKQAYSDRIKTIRSKLRRA